MQTHKIESNLEIHQKVAQKVLDMQGAVNLRAITSSMVAQMDELRAVGITGDLLNNHPTVLAFVSKLNSLTRFDSSREMAAFNHLEDLKEGKPVTYEVIPL